MTRQAYPPSVPVSVDKTLTFPEVKPGPDERHIHAVGSLYRILVGVMLYLMCRVDIAAVIHEMHTVESHKARSSSVSVQVQGAAFLVRFRARVTTLRHSMH